VYRLLRAAMYTWNGLSAAARGEVAFRQELVLLAVAVPLAFLIAQGMWKRLALVAVILLVLVAELLNSAIERLGDRVTLTREPEMARIKDMGSAAVGVALGLAAMVWLVALGEFFTVW
jgi:diacylglycerol kinase (ATP)